MKSDHSVEILDPADLSLKVEFKDFFGQAGDPCIPMKAYYSDKSGSLCGMFDKAGVVYAVIQASPTAAKSVFKLQHSIRIEDDDPSLFYPVCMQRTVHENFMLVGGSSAQDVRMGSSILAVYRVGSVLPCIDKIELFAGVSTKTMTVGSIARAPDWDLFVVGTYTTVFLVEWNSIQLVVQSAYPQTNNCSRS